MFAFRVRNDSKETDRKLLECVCLSQAYPRCAFYGFDLTSKITIAPIFLFRFHGYIK